MPVQDLFKPLTLPRGPALKNRLLLAPLTNWQSNPDGTVSEHEAPWLSRCAAGGFSMVMTCAAHVHPFGQAFPGQLGIHSDEHLPGLRKIADEIRANRAISSVQLHHGGVRVDPRFGGTPVGPSDFPATGGRGLTLVEVENLRDDFIAAAKRAENAGFDGVEIHGAFGWVVMEFLSPLFNKRTDRYGGSFENRARLLFEIIGGIRATCGADFQIGLRISMERYGWSLLEAQLVAKRAIEEEEIDYLDLAVWDYRKIAQEEPFEGRSLLSVFTELPRSSVRLGASGHIMSARQAVEVLDAGCDFVILGKAAILDPGFPNAAEKTPDYHAPALPVTGDWLKRSGLSDKFIEYMRTWEGFVANDGLL
ncbi:unnamed protein product [Penicillium salamii]|uniref:NADH:flavin oxidoreductase/NADH oxidase N-terminal domain-containing protein n=1 Tax=Penicillium salamii TaxID=1612424 RepID=A0A9W4J013_9EURO|nr:unnamed protein product [Penicillium salamii]